MAAGLKRMIIENKKTQHSSYKIKQYLWKLSMTIIWLKLIYIKKKQYIPDSQMFFVIWIAMIKERDIN